MGSMADKKTERDQRLAKALRENLKRRKAQARAIGEAKGPLPHPADGPPPRAGED
jgi:hypothetical protein